MDQRTAEIPTADIDDETATARVFERLGEIHGGRYDFSLRDWEGRAEIERNGDRICYGIVVEADGSRVTVGTGDSVLGPPEEGQYRPTDGRFSTATESHTAAIRSGDVFTIGPDDDPVEVTGSGTAFVVSTEHTAYPSPRFGFLRNVGDDVAGCATYEGAFRREMLPPEQSDQRGDARGVNRVNVHTLDMRHDREPGPVQHCHAPVSAGRGRRVNHTETALVLDRSEYGLSPVQGSDEHVRIFRNPREDPTDWFDVSVEPGTILVTPATAERIYGHCFRNTFAALVAVPSFTAPLHEIGKDKERAGETHRKYHE